MTDEPTTHDLTDDEYDALEEAFRVAMKRGDREAYERVRMSLEAHDVNRNSIINRWLDEIVIDEAEDGVSARSRYDEVTIETENFTATYELYENDTGWFANEETTFIHKDIDAGVRVEGFPSRHVRNEVGEVCKEKMEYTPTRDHPSLTAAERNPDLANGNF